ncbi:MAG: hypothetical protein WCR05_10820 [Sphaerochaetaceae bacterium]
MKKVISILLVLVAAAGFAFAAIEATLDLTTTVGNVLESSLVEGSSALTLENFNNSQITVSKTVASTGLDVDLAYAYKTNLTSTPTVTVSADALETTGGLKIPYTITVGSTPTEVTADGTSVTLLDSADDASPTSGLRVISKVFNVKVTEAAMTAAAAGSYSATVTFTVAAS